MVKTLICTIATILMISLLRPALAESAWLAPQDKTVATVVCTEDNQFSWYNGPGNPQEWGLNFGAATRTRLKGHQDITALKFDLSSFKGRTVVDAELHLARADSIPIFAMVVSTINADWHEGKERGAEAKAGESCWRWRSRPADETHPGPNDEWTFPHSDFSTAAFGNYGSLVSYGYRTSGTFGTYRVNDQTWIRMKLDPDIVRALICDQFGLAVTDPRGYNHQNPQVFTNDQYRALAPRLRIRFGETLDRQSPDAVTSLAANEGPNEGELVLSFQAPHDPESDKAFGYNVLMSDTDDVRTARLIERWRIPRPAVPGTLQRVLIEDLNPGALVFCFVQAYDAAGNGSSMTECQYRTPPRGRGPALLHVGSDKVDPAGFPIRTVAGVLRYWVCPETTKVNPRTGNRMEDGFGKTGSNAYKKSNSIWNSETNTVSLTASGNEMIGFQVILERLGGNLTHVTVGLSDFTGPSQSKIPAATSVETFQLHYVASDNLMFPDAAIPLIAPFPRQFNIPDATHNPKGVNQSVWVDVYIPKDVTPGIYTGHVSVSAKEFKSVLAIPVRIQVSGIQIPDVPSFIIDMNGYGNQWTYGNTDVTRLKWFQACHKHRVSLNTLPYGWNANIVSGRAPVLAGEGGGIHVSNWTRFDQAYGPFFDGTAFSPARSDSAYYGPGMNTPVSTFYTPFFESWPIPLLDTQYGFDAAGRGGAYWNHLIDVNPEAFWADAPDVMRAMPQAYQQGVEQVVKAWMEHAEEKGWHQTNFQIYLNHKYSYHNCAALWILEECATGDDFRAVNFFHSLYRQGAAMANAPHVKWHYRIDISTRWGQNYGQLDDLINWVVISNDAVDWHWPNLRYRNVLNAEPEQWVWYGTGPAPQDPGIRHAQRMLRAWAQGLDGGVPYWDNFQTSWRQAKAFSMVYSGKQVPGFGRYEGPVMSIRVKMMRQAEQIIELANLLAQQEGWNRERVTNALLKNYGDGQWDRSFAGLTQEKLDQLRADLMTTLSSCLTK